MPLGNGALKVDMVCFICMIFNYFYVYLCVFTDKRQGRILGCDRLLLWDLTENERYDLVCRNSAGQGLGKILLGRVRLIGAAAGEGGASLPERQARQGGRALQLAAEPRDMRAR
ncbi:hypothetical protein C2U68_10830 [Methylomonas koyamae]|nr:hypothetical protein C2U68_10830 [Methylomonas koyamae]